MSRVQLEKLLRVLQEGEVRPLGSQTVIKVNDQRKMNMVGKVRDTIGNVREQFNNVKGQVQDAVGNVRNTVQNVQQTVQNAREQP